MIGKMVATSAVTAEVKAKPAKVGAEEKILAGIKQAWLELKNSDKSWEQIGRKFGKWCSELRKLYKKPGSRKGKGFEATVKKLGVNYEKARYWADEVDGKNKKKARNYAGKAPAKTTTEPKAEPKPTPFTLTGLGESEQGEIAKAVQYCPVTFSRFVYGTAVEPDESQVRYLVNRCLGKLDLQNQVDFLGQLGKWIEGELTNLREDIKAGATVSSKARALAFLDVEENDPNQLSTLLNKMRELGADKEPVVLADVTEPVGAAA